MNDRPERFVNAISTRVVPERCPAASASRLDGVALGIRCSERNRPLTGDPERRHKKAPPELEGANGEDW
ncbi:MAG: hypothetical protein EBW87_00805 [Burkholderiaceae bacterium]|nr:hypothetical protein [Burkholderiaceae bacterium]